MGKERDQFRSLRELEVLILKRRSTSTADKRVVRLRISWFSLQRREMPIGGETVVLCRERAKPYIRRHGVLRLLIAFDRDRPEMGQFDISIIIQLHHLQVTKLKFTSLSRLEE